jgi:hypothetical protein
MVRVDFCFRGCWVQGHAPLPRGERGGSRVKGKRKLPGNFFGDRHFSGGTKTRRARPCPREGRSPLALHDAGSLPRLRCTAAGGDAQGALPSIFFRYVGSLGRLRSVRPKWIRLCRSANFSSKSVSYSFHVTPSTPGAASRFRAKKLSRSGLTVTWLKPRSEPRPLVLMGCHSHTPRWRPRARPCMTRGQDGSLNPSCVTFPFTTPRRFIPAHSAPRP